MRISWHSLRISYVFSEVIRGETDVCLSHAICEASHVSDTAQAVSFADGEHSKVRRSKCVLILFVSPSMHNLYVWIAGSTPKRRVNLQDQTIIGNGIEFGRAAIR